ncbi:MAG: ABC transporter ATP-binding protein [Mariprofundaceae bacterium]
MSAVLEMADLALARGGRCLFTGLSGRLAAGEILVVMGSNGAGKSSLLLALAGMIPAAGGIRVSGRRIADLHPRERAETLAWLGALPPVDFGLTVRERLSLAANGDDGIGRAAACMEVSGLLARRLGALSSGERQRVELAALMLRDAPLWLVDEPTAHLDLRHQAACLRMLREEAAAGRAVVVVLHDIPQALAVADQAVLLDGKGGAAMGPASGLLTRERLESLFGVRLRGDATAPDFGPADG